VIAVDAQGNRSVPTAIVTLASPALSPAEIPPAVAGQPYSATLPARLRTGRYVIPLRYDQADGPHFSIRTNTGADWLEIDPSTGVLSGVPPADVSGVFELTVTLEDGRGGKCERLYRLRVNRSR